MKKTFSTVLLSFIFLYSFASSDSLVFSSVQDTLIKDDSTVFFNHFYHRYVLGDDVYINRNMGSAINYPVRPDEVNLILPGWQSLLNFREDALDTNSSVIRYVKASKLEQAFTAGLKQRIFNTFLLEAAFRSINSPGFLINQLNKTQNYYGRLGYLSRNNRLTGSLSVSPSVINNQVNGGIVNDSLLFNIDNNAGRSLEVYLKDASLKIRNNTINHKITYTFPAGDSAITSYNIGYDICYNRNSVIYKSKSINSDFYEYINYDSTATDDSLFNSDLRIIAKPGTSINLGSFHLNANLLLGQQWRHYHYFSGNTDIKSDILGINIGMTNSGLAVNLSGEFSRNENRDNSGEFKLNLNYTVNPKGLMLFVDAGRKNMIPALFYSDYSSNHFIWHSSFRNITVSEIAAGINNATRSISLSGSISTINNFVYFNERAFPSQYHESINLMRARGNIRQRITGKLHLYSDIIWQQTSVSEILPTPDLYTYTAIYRESRIFKSVMRIAYGAGCTYYTSFNSNAFMPATGQFYLQHEVKAGGEPILDFFVDFRIKSLNAFARLENFGRGFINDEYFYLPGTPAPGRTFKAGISWKFSDNYFKR